MQWLLNRLQTSLGVKMYNGVESFSILNALLARTGRNWMDEIGDYRRNEEERGGEEENEVRKKKVHFADEKADGVLVETRILEVEEGERINVMPCTPEERKLWNYEALQDDIGRWRTRHLHIDEEEEEPGTTDQKKARSAKHPARLIENDADAATDDSAIISPRSPVPKAPESASAGLQAVLDGLKTPGLFKTPDLLKDISTAPAPVLNRDTQARSGEVDGRDTPLSDDSDDDEPIALSPNSQSDMVISYTDDEEQRPTVAKRPRLQSPTRGIRSSRSSTVCRKVQKDEDDNGKILAMESKRAMQIWDVVAAVLAPARFAGHISYKQQHAIVGKCLDEFMDRLYFDKMRTEDVARAELNKIRQNMRM